jgi:fluoride exporter
MKTLTALFLVGLGGAIGCIGRYLITLAAQPLSVSFPNGTLIVNYGGCLIIGAVAGLIDAQVAISSASRLFLVTGLCGGLTTMSSFVYETERLLQDGQTFHAAGYFAATLTGSFALFFIGYFVMKAVFR